MVMVSGDNSVGLQTRLSGMIRLTMVLDIAGNLSSKKDPKQDV